MLGKRIDEAVESRVLIAPNRSAAILAAPISRLEAGAPQATANQAKATENVLPNIKSPQMDIPGRHGNLPIFTSTE
jgi:hypothetical protein